MNIFKLGFKIILQLFFFIIFFSTLHTRNVDKFDEGNYIANYFSGIVLLNDSKYNESYKFLKKLDGLENRHIDYSSKYLFSLINLKKFNEAFNYSKKLEKRKLDNFESNLIIGIHYLRNANYNLAQKYFLKLKARKSGFLLNDFVSTSLSNWVSFDNLDINDARKKINKMNPQYENLINIQNVFLNCFYRNKETELSFENLTSNKKVDFSRYNYFYANYLSNIGKIKKAKKVIESSIELYPRNLLLNQFKYDFYNEKHKNIFNCQNPSHINAEILYIVANAYSSQQIFDLSNFYLNLSKYLNKDFRSFDTLLAENFYKINNLEQARKIYNVIGKNGNAYFWYSAKQNAKILVKEDKKDKALSILSQAYEKLPNKNIYEKYDYAKFLKSNGQFEKSIKYFTEIIESISRTHSLYPLVADDRGVAYERIGEWEKAEKDLLLSLEVSPNQAYVINYLAYSWIEKGVKIEKSLEMLQRANKLKSNDPYIIDSLGWALFKLKRYNDAKKYLQSAVKLMPADPIVNDHYGDVLWMNGKKLQARYYWNNVLKLKDVEEDLKINIKNKLISGL
tara:strand:+ start:1761 stop:3455 length:1695 start_codon:yes stop_codon:yes gene_type:complete